MCYLQSLCWQNKRILVKKFKLNTFVLWFTRNISTEQTKLETYRNLSSKAETIKLTE